MPAPVIGCQQLLVKQNNGGQPTNQEQSEKHEVSIRGLPETAKVCAIGVSCSLGMGKGGKSDESCLGTPAYIHLPSAPFTMLQEAQLAELLTSKLGPDAVTNVYFLKNRSDGTFVGSGITPFALLHLTSCPDHML